MYYTVIKHDGHLRTREKCLRLVFSTFLSCSQMSGIEFTREKQQNTLFLCFIHRYIF